jgi:hypothetical protein
VSWYAVRSSSVRVTFSKKSPCQRECGWWRS